MAAAVAAIEELRAMLSYPAAIDAWHARIREASETDRGQALFPAHWRDKVRYWTGAPAAIPRVRQRLEGILVDLRAELPQTLPGRTPPTLPVVDGTSRPIPGGRAVGSLTSDDRKMS